MTTETLPTVVPLEPTTPIKPSEAIRLGCLIAPVQIFEETYTDEIRRGACVYGAMALGYGSGWDGAWAKSVELHDDNQWFDECPADDCAMAANPVHLNDDHRWSRERIADWLAGLGL